MRTTAGTTVLGVMLFLHSSAFAFDVGFTSSQNKVFFEPPYEFLGAVTDTASISLAKNEYEAVQMVIFPAGSMNDVEVAVGDLTRTSGAGQIPSANIEVNVVGYVNQLQAKVSGDRIGWIPDPLLPNQPLDLSNNAPQPYLITVHTLDTTRSGMYEGEITISANGALSLTLTLRVNVWNFTLPNTPVFKTMALTEQTAPDDMWPGQITSQAQRDTLLFRLADIAFRNRIPIQNAIGSGLYSWNSGGAGNTDYGYPTHDAHVFNPTRTGERIDYMLSKGVNNIVLGFTYDIYDPCCDTTARKTNLLNYLRDMRGYLISRGLLDIAYVYNIDEPWGDQVDHAKKIYRLIKDSVGADMRIMQNTNQDNAAIIGTFMNYFDGLDINLGHYYINDADSYRASYPAPMADFWWNVNIWPDTHPNLFLEYPLVDARTFGPLSFKFNMQGFEYWNIKSKWSIGSHHPIASDELRVTWNVNLRSLDGLLVYAGSNFDIYSSLRFESFRDGMEDYEYLELLRQRDPDNPLLDVSIVTGLTTFTQDPFEILEFREQIAAVLDSGFVWGDANGNGVVTAADIVFIINYVFKGGPSPEPLEAADVTSDGSITVADIICLVGYVFKGGDTECTGAVAGYRESGGSYTKTYLTEAGNAAE
jgi:hypothetical protein